MKFLNNIHLYFLLLLPTTFFAQINGHVYDSKTHKALEGATVFMTKDNFAITDKEGFFELKQTLIQTNYFTVDYIGYKAKIVDVKGEKDYKIYLMPEVILLPEINYTYTDMVKNKTYEKFDRSLSEPINTGELFKEINGFSLVKRSNYAVEPVLRGLTYERLNVQYDGGLKVYHACPNRMDPATNQVDPNDVESIEVIKGPFSVRYGPIFGGLVNIKTKALTPTASRKVYGEVSAGIESNGLSTTSNLKLGMSNNLLNLFVSGGYKNYSDYKDGSGTVVPSSFKVLGFNTEAAFFLKSNQKLQVKWRQTFAKDIGHAALPMDSDFDNSILSSIDYEINALPNKIKSLKTKFYLSSVDHKMSNGFRPNFVMMDAQTPVKSLSIGGKVEAMLDLNTEDILFLGLDFNNLSREGSRTRIIKKNMMGQDLDPYIIKVDPIWQDAALQNVGLFAESTKRINHKMELSGGIRMDYVHADAQSLSNDFMALYNGINREDNINLSADASLRIENKHLLTQISLGRGVRAPNMEEIYINHFAIGSDGFEYVGNPLLKTEKNLQLELSNNYSTSKLKIESSFFISKLSDFITAELDTTLARKYGGSMSPSAPNFKRFSKKYTNIDDALRLGGEVSINYQIIESLGVKGQVNYTYTVDLDNDEPLPMTPPFVFDLSLHYTKDKFWSGLLMSYNAEQNRIAESFGEVASPYNMVLDFKLGFEPIKKLTIGISVNNIFDATYYNHLNFSFANQPSLTGVVFEPGRNFTGLIKYRF